MRHNDTYTYKMYYIITTDILTQNPQIWMKSTLRKKQKIIEASPVYYAFCTLEIGIADIQVLQFTGG